MDRKKLINEAHSYIVSDRAFLPLHETIADFAIQCVQAERDRVVQRLLRIEQVTSLDVSEWQVCQISILNFPAICAILNIPLLLPYAP